MTWRTVYAALAAVGFLLPLSAFLPWLAENGVQPALFVGELFSTRIAAFFGWDVIVSAAVLFAFIAAERGRLEVRHRWLPVAGTLLVGVSFGLPLYLWMREGALRRG